MKHLFLTSLILSTTFTLLFTSCNGGGESSNTSKKAEVKMAEAPSFNEDSAYYFIEKQVAFGPRVPNTKAHQECGDYLIEQLKEYGAEVTVQAFEATAYNGAVLPSRNIIGAINPEAKKRIIVAAHWDTRPYADQGEERQQEPIDGANDGGSGVGVILELARVMHTDSLKPNVGVDFILFDSEDYGRPEFEKEYTDGDSRYCLGSEYWASNKHKRGYHAYYGILLDMVGAKGAVFPKEGTSMELASKVVKKIWTTGQKLGYGQYFIDQEVGGIFDDHYYVNTKARIPMADIIHLDPTGTDTFFEHWHTHEDNLETIDKASLKAVGQTVLQVLYNE
ncbi:M28 family peptidase [Algivirga pacifica]|uniref:M28 family peptidase n=1 Tax=Algivirga pacifica TaxID=1162670 RepID=A0ABP9DHE4_9BACT